MPPRHRGLQISQEFVGIGPALRRVTLLEQDLVTRQRRERNPRHFHNELLAYDASGQIEWAVPPANPVREAGRVPAALSRRPSGGGSLLLCWDASRPRIPQFGSHRGGRRDLFLEPSGRNVTPSWSAPVSFCLEIGRASCRERG